MSTFDFNPFVWLFILFFIGTPIVLTIINFVFLFYRKGNYARLLNVSDGFTFVLGVSFTALLFSMGDFPEWREPLIIGGGSMFKLHTPIAHEFFITFLTFALIALCGYTVLRIKKVNLPPLITTLCISGIFIGITLSLVCGIQITQNISNELVILFLLFPLNYILCSLRLLREVLTSYAKKAIETQYDNKLLNLCNNILKKAPNIMMFSFILTLPVFLIVIIILLLFGQTPDSFIKMFTSTADWTLSQQIPPPPVEYQGHYLCTVAAGGDEKIVKPLRTGYRQNAKIIVNRQLLVANAFEDLIKERLPIFHKMIRNIYDKYGFPLSNHITNKKRANAIYILMKPLEWVFVLTLYTFDQTPENRIAIQYTVARCVNV